MVDRIKTDIHEVSGIRALRKRPEQKTPASGVAAAFHPQFSETAVRAFKRAGWEFVSSQDARVREAIPGEVARVLKERDGRILLAPGAVVVGFKNGAGAEAMLRRMGFEVERLPVGTNVYRVRPKDDTDQDALRLVALLCSNPDVEFAEPELLEALHR